ncbi:hypothetical protein ACLK17_18665 [Escherichia coli]
MLMLCCSGDAFDRWFYPYKKSDYYINTHTIFESGYQWLSG